MALEAEIIPTKAEIGRGLREAFERIWDTAVALPRFPRAAVHSFEITDPWDGAVAWIGGTWTGNVRIFCSPGLAAVISKAVLPDLEGSPSDVSQQDVMRELANMVAGNLKSLLGGCCALATPGNFTVKSLADLEDDFRPMATITYQVGPLTIQISASELVR